ncbi:hypothetical protein [Actinoplanes sp. G11-F43]|uniref:hypothetical protein n=1 Tax=Actinoplanes sp. G11-F43 TaxID=3424130 RepID=UPI003D34B625
MIAFTDWKDPNRSAGLDLATKGMAVVTVAFFFLAPLGIAAVARKEGLRRTAVAYVILAVALAFLALIQLTVSPF